jgi:general secretion pathway protein B
MSFILDALRKSENERQQSAVPGIARIPIAPPRSVLPRWAGALIALLALSVLVLGAAWWRSLTSEPARVAGTASAPAADTAQPRSVAAALRGEDAMPRTAEDPRPAAVRSEPPATSALTTLAVPTRARAPATTEAPSGSVTSLPTASAPPRSGTPVNLLPTLSELQSDGVMLPELRLELHAYSANSAQRFVFINGRRYAEGETLPEGPRLVAITPELAVLSYGGAEFTLTTQ